MYSTTRILVAAGMLSICVAASAPTAPSATASAAIVEETIFRAGADLVVRVPSLARLRQTHRTLPATVRWNGPGGEKVVQFDWADRAYPEAIVVDVAGYGPCTAVEVDVRDASGRSVHAQRIAPVPEVQVDDRASVAGAPLAAIEAGSQLAGEAAPRIVLPDRGALRVERLGEPTRVATTSEITYPVVAEVDLPIPSSINAVVVSRQSFAPDDPSKCSLYFSYRKGLFDPATSRLKEYRKMLVEVPLDARWLAGSDDRVVTLPTDGFAIHTTDEREIAGTRWDAPEGYNMLGRSSTGLYQGGSTVDVDDQGRIYVTNVPDGAGIVRFNPHTRRFEQPPVNFYAECRKFLPTDAPWRRSWDADLAQVVCTRGRVYLVFDRHYRVTTPNGKFETCSGVVSLPQDHWDDAEAFRRDLRLHAGCWPQATPSLYRDDVAEGQPRRAGAPVATTHGIAFGTWRLDLDAAGNTLRLATVKSLADTVAADGTSLEPTEIVTVDGLPQQRRMNVGAAGRAFVTAEYGEFRISRAALSLTVPGAPREHLVDEAGKYRSTYPGAPSGTLLVRFDITGKIRAERQKFATLAAALSGVSQGPNYAVIAVPDEADRALGVCEYGYYLSKLDFSRRASERKVFRSYLPSVGADGARSDLPISLGLGPYNLAWVEHDGARWLYATGYTGMGRLKYAVDGRALDACEQEIIHRRLTPQPIDGVPREAVKDYLHVLPALGGKLIDIGRGRPGRGGGAHSAGLEWFDPTTLGPSRTAVAMNRCYGLYTPVGRVVFAANTSQPRQEIFAASGEIRPEYVADLADPARRPQNQDPKIFAYECDAAGLRDLYGFALPTGPDGRAASNIAFSRCRRYLVVLQEDGSLHAFDVSRRRFVDGVRLRTAGDVAPRLLSFSRPSTWIWTAPDGRAFFGVAADAADKTVRYYEVRTSLSGRLTVAPQAAVRCEGAETAAAYDGIVHGFLPDLVRNDGSFDLVLGGSQENGGQPTVRVIDDFAPPAVP